MQKEQLQIEIQLRIAHNQHQIENIKETIRIFLKHKYKAEFDNLVHVIPKLNRFLIQCKDSSTDYSKLACPDTILDMDFLYSIISKYTKDLPSVRLMTIEENYIYRSLVEDEHDTEEGTDLDFAKIGQLKEDEREKLLFKPFHDQNIS